MNTSMQGSAVWYGDIFQLPEGVEDFMLDTGDDPILDSEDLTDIPTWKAGQDVVTYDSLMNIQDFYVAEGMDCKEMYDEQV